MNSSAVNLVVTLRAREGEPVACVRISGRIDRTSEPTLDVMVDRLASANPERAVIDIGSGWFQRGTLARMIVRLANALPEASMVLCRPASAARPSYARPAPEVIAARGHHPPSVWAAETAVRADRQGTDTRLMASPRAAGANGHSCSVTVRPGHRVEIALSGDIDAAASGSLDHAVRDAAATRPRTVEVDLRAVSFFGAAGSTFLARLRRLAAERGAAFTIRSGPPLVQRLPDLLDPGDSWNGSTARRSDGAAGTRVDLAGRADRLAGLAPGGPEDPTVVLGRGSTSRTA